MKKTIFALALGAMLVVPTGAMAAPTKADTKAASKECHDLRAAMGKENFKAEYGNFGKCVSKKSREEKAERKAARREAREACKAQGLKGKERAACVREQKQANKADADETDEKRVNAARQCRAEQKADPDAFGETYGTKRNAFGKCVSTKAKAQNDETEDEQDDEQQA
jgi:hypothetical protein